MPRKKNNPTETEATPTEPFVDTTGEPFVDTTGEPQGDEPVDDVDTIGDPATENTDTGDTTLVTDEPIDDLMSGIGQTPEEIESQEEAEAAEAGVNDPIEPTTAEPTEASAEQPEGPRFTLPGRVDLYDISLRDQAALYNLFAKSPVTRFRSTASGVTRLRALFSQVEGAKPVTEGLEEGAEPSVYDLPSPPEEGVDDGKTAKAAREPRAPKAPRQDSEDYWPSMYDKDATVHFVKPYEARPGTNAELDIQVFSQNDGAKLASVVGMLKTRFSAIRYWRKKGVIRVDGVLTEEQQAQLEGAPEGAKEEEAAAE